MENSTEKVRKRKLLTDPDKLHAKCQVCKEPGNTENMIWHKIPFKDINGKILHGCYERVYFCGEDCKGLFKI